MELSINCTQSQIKANTGRNTSLKLLSNRSVFYPANWGINERINYKAMFANPLIYYRQFWELAEIKEKRNQLKYH